MILRQAFDNALARLQTNDVLSYRVISGNMRIQVQCLLWYGTSPEQVLVNGVARNVLSVEQIGSFWYITLAGPNPTVPLTWSPLPPKAFVGTPKDVNNRLTSATDKYPFVWLLMPFVQEQGDSDQSYTTFDVRLFFLTPVGDDQTGDTTDANVAIMDRLADAFLEAFEDLPNVKEYRNVTKVAHTKFGQQADGGAQQSILDDILAGIELRFNLDLFKNCC